MPEAQFPPSPSSPEPWWQQRLAALLPLDRTRLVVLAVAGLATLLIGAVVMSALKGSAPPVEVRLPQPEVDASSQPPEGRPNGAKGLVYVHAAGAVSRPGVYKLVDGSRVADVLDAAGGPAPDADLNQLNLAAKVADGERVYVARRGEPPPAPGGPSEGAGPASPSAGPVDLNTATAEQLEGLPGVGPATAQAILQYRKEHGRFKSVEDLLEVRGIGQAKLASLRSKVRV